MYRPSAAHKTLPLGTYVRVKNLANKTETIVRINDRGPFVGDRVLDLSYAAAKELDIDKQGIGKVEIVAISEKQAIPKMKKLDSTKDKSLFLQVGSFKNPKKAQKLQHKISAHHLANVEIRPSTYKKSTVYKVQIGPFESQSGAIQLAQKLSEIGISGTQFVTASNHL